MRQVQRNRKSNLEMTQREEGTVLKQDMAHAYDYLRRYRA